MQQRLQTGLPQPTCKRLQTAQAAAVKLHGNSSASLTFTCSFAGYQAPATDTTMLAGFPSLGQGGTQRVLAEWDQARNGDATPDSVSLMSSRKMHWLCAGCASCGERHSWEAVISSRTCRGVQHSALR